MQGGALYLLSDRTEVAGCTLRDNTASVDGGGMFLGAACLRDLRV